MSDQSASSEVSIRAAVRDDLDSLIAQIECFVERGQLLPRTTDELEQLIAFGFVADCNGEIAGFAALEIYSAKLAEIRSLFVGDAFQNRGIGKRLVQSCLNLARDRNILEVLVVTSEEHFFRACGFDYTLPGAKKALFVQTREKA